MADMTADEIHAQMYALRSQSAQQAVKIELGHKQRAVLEQANHDAAGFDSGPLVEFQGLPVVKSRRDDHLRLLAEGDNGEDVEVTAASTEEPNA